jgi:hypothetical protein
MFATCRTCGQEMDGISCTTQRAYRWGQEPDWQSSSVLRQVGPPTWQPCRSCHVAPGGFHHERCSQATCRLGCPLPNQARYCEHALDDDDGGGDELPLRLPEPSTQPTIH